MKKGFSLIELTVVLVVIGVLISMTVKGRDLLDAARIRKDIYSIIKIETALSQYVSRNHPTGDLKGLHTSGIIDPSIFDQHEFAGISMNVPGAAVGSLWTMRLCACKPVDADNYTYRTTLTPEFDASNICLHNEALGGSAAAYTQERYVCYAESYLDDKSNTKGRIRSTTTIVNNPQNCNGYSEALTGGLQYCAF